MTGPQLAAASNVLVYSAILVYTFALITFAVDLGRARQCAPAEPLAPASTAAEGSSEAGALRSSLVCPVSVVSRVSPVGVGILGRGLARAAGVARSLTWLAFVLHTAGVAARAAATGRPPWGNMYEFAVSGASVVTAAYLGTSWLGERRYLGAFVVGPVVLTLGLAVTVLYTEAGQLVPALRSFWLAIHVSVAFVAAALFTLGFSASVLQLLQDSSAAKTRRDGSEEARARFLQHLPDAQALEHTAYQFNAVAFPLWTFALMSGAIWAEAAWGRYWGWDPKEVWSFIIWVLYAAYLHARVTRGWTGRKAAYLSLAGYTAVLVNFGIVNVFVVGLHSYAGVS
ncbi:MAG: c-type cytochrome biogenesis protein CcsB [Actinobacteria bacterium]|nr:c-type cytochrome biogenesis protein CcsB [Actinomycetota bacterium]